MERFDIAVIGTGPAGLSAAVTAKLRSKSVLLLGSKALSPKVQKAEQIQNYLGLPAVSGQQLAAAFAAHLKQLALEITEDKINAVYAMGDHFALQGNGTSYEARAVILATGANFGRPLPGETELLGRGVSYCATCDAPLYRGKRAAVVGYSPKEEAEAEYLAQLCEQVIYLPQYQQPTQLSAKVQVVAEAPAAIESEGGSRVLVTRQGSRLAVDGVFVLREAISPTQLVPGLESRQNHVQVDRGMATNIPGCFACGDVVGTPYQYIKSAGEGNVAALSAVAYLDAQARNQKNV